MCLPKINLEWQSQLFVITGSANWKIFKENLEMSDIKMFVPTLMCVN